MDRIHLAGSLENVLPWSLTSIRIRPSDLYYDSLEFRLVLLVSCWLIFDVVECPFKYKRFTIIFEWLVSCKNAHTSCALSNPTTCIIWLSSRCIKIAAFVFLNDSGSLNFMEMNGYEEDTMKISKLEDIKQENLAKKIWGYEACFKNQYSNVNDKRSKGMVHTIRT